MTMRAGSGNLGSLQSVRSAQLASRRTSIAAELLMGSKPGLTSRRPMTGFWITNRRIRCAKRNSKRNNENISGSCRRLQCLCDVTAARIETQPDEAWEL